MIYLLRIQSGHSGKGALELEKLSLVFPIAAAVFVLLFFMGYWTWLRQRDLIPASVVDEPAGLAFPRRRFPMERRDMLPLVIIMAVYAAVAFTGLGINKAPQTFCQFAESGRYALIELKEEREISRVMYYSGLYSGKYYLQFSTDGENWVDQVSMEQSHADLFKWQYAELQEERQKVKYVRIISDGKLELGELVLYDEKGEIIPNDLLVYDEGCAPLFDERDTIPDEPDYLNSAYFDEIYHARTAYENVTNVYPYETSHPPLGKLIISIGIRIFGMTPFGWRFMGTLFGVIMLLPLYIFLKNMFGSTAIAACGTAIIAFDFMHFVQTRIATIDTYAVFFIIFMYFFMYRYLTADKDDPLLPRWKTWLPLFFSGLSFGLGAASKWTCIYAGAGLALLWLLNWIFRGRDLIRSGQKRRLRRELLGNIACCILFFVIIPAVIYYASYWPYGRAKGMSGLSMYFDRDYLDIVVKNQKFMYGYHSDLVAEHAYSSVWYQWVFDIRPILYYLHYFDDYTKSAFGAFVNPLLCWGGLLAVITMAVLAAFKKDGRALFILIGYLAQLVPWMFVSRLTFAYHYFPSTVFLLLGLCHVFNTLRLKNPRWKRPVYCYTALCLVLFVAFYPVLTGIPVYRWYTGAFLRWIPGMWPF
jgi:dolichyl-phosphate-mannose-protein mannosyltransferase